jgi:hypothetical protein
MWQNTSMETPLLLMVQVQFSDQLWFQKVFMRKSKRNLNYKHFFLKFEIELSIDLEIRHKQCFSFKVISEFLGVLWSFKISFQ